MLDEGRFRSRWFAIGASFQAHDHVVLDRKQRNAIDVVDLHPRLQCFLKGHYTYRYTTLTSSIEKAFTGFVVVR